MNNVQYISKMKDRFELMKDRQDMLCFDCLFFVRFLPNFYLPFSLSPRFIGGFVLLDNCSSL